MADTMKRSDGVQGEGDYQAGRTYQQNTSAAAQDINAIAAAARKAAEAIDGPEGVELEQARRDTAAVKPS